MVNVPWPAKLQPQSFHYFHIDADVSGGASLGGNEQFVASPGSRWGAVHELPIFDNEGVLAMRALRTQFEGGANPVILPNFDGQRQCWPVEPGTDRVLTPRVAHWLRRHTRPRRHGLCRRGHTDRAEITGTVTTAAALDATQIVITMTQGGPIKAGQQFGYSALVLYEIGKSCRWPAQ